jgi:hypothetical protein
MRFLFRMAFWFSLVLLVPPLGGHGSNDSAGVAGEARPQPVGAIETFLAAREAVVDFIGLCERKPEVCEVGRSAMNTVGVRAREAARIAFALLDEKFGESDQTVVTGSVPPKDVGAEPTKLGDKAPIPSAKATAPQQ